MSSPETALVLEDQAETREHLLAALSEAFPGVVARGAGDLAEARSFLDGGGLPDLALVDLPDPYDDALYAEAEAFARAKGDYAAFFVTRIGIFPTMLSMGLETFSIALYENRPFLERVLDIYTDWAVAVTRRACQLGFDVYASTDDMAFKSAPFFSPKVFHELVMPRYRRVAAEVTLRRQHHAVHGRPGKPGDRWRAP